MASRRYPEAAPYVGGFSKPVGNVYSGAGAEPYTREEVLEGKFTEVLGRITFPAEDWSGLSRHSGQVTRMRSSSGIPKLPGSANSAIVARHFSFQSTPARPHPGSN